MNQFRTRQNPLCRQIQDILEVYLADELDVSTQAMIKAHIAFCPKCQDEVRFAEAISEALKELPKPEPPPKIFNAVSALCSRVSGHRHEMDRSDLSGIRISG